MRDDEEGAASSTAVSCGARLDGALDVAGETTARTGGEALLGEVLDHGATIQW